MAKLTPIHWQVLQALAGGQTLKAHRDIEGHKAYRLHALDGTTAEVDWAVAEMLQAEGWIDSNKKFPAATYWLTTKAKTLLQKINDAH